MRLRKESDDMHEEEILLMAKISDALAHPARIKIFRFVMKQNAQRTKVCNKDVVANFNYAQATISQHIKTLVKAGLIDVKKEEKYSYYYANIGMLMQYLNITKKFE
ncbi:MAG: helix-turn-helix domain-containing protein [Anaerovoracaceae bacterium]